MSASSIAMITGIGSILKKVKLLGIVNGMGLSTAR
jgi:hypothetical protein